MLKIIGISEDCTECSLCGRTNLKKTIIIENDEGIENYYGTECAANLLKIAKKDVIKTVKAELLEQKKQAEQLKIKQWKQFEPAREYARNNLEYRTENELLNTKYANDASNKEFSFKARLEQSKKVEAIYKRLYDEYLIMYPGIVKY